jgi:DNA repair exonuclease SbcCD ATPase subunit
MLRMRDIPKNDSNGDQNMAKVGAQRAAELTGRSKSTIQRAMNNGKVSYELDGNGRRLVDVSELDRAFGLRQGNSGSGNSPSVEQELEKASSMLEMERLKMRIKMLEDQVTNAENQISDLKDQRDQWQKQASQVLITSQFSQKQAEELRAEIKERDRRALERRQQKLDEHMKRMRANNQNATSAQDEPAEAATAGAGFKGLWKRVKDRA